MVGAKPQLLSKLFPFSVKGLVTRKLTYSDQSKLVKKVNLCLANEQSAIIRYSPCWIATCCNTLLKDYIIREEKFIKAHKVLSRKPDLKFCVQCDCLLLSYVRRKFWNSFRHENGERDKLSKW